MCIQVLLFENLIGAQYGWMHRDLVVTPCWFHTSLLQTSQHPIFCDNNDNNTAEQRIDIVVEQNYTKT